MCKKFIYLMSFVLVLALASNASAITHIWTGLGDGSSWVDSDNWDGDGVDGTPFTPSQPGSSDTTEIGRYEPDVHVVFDGVTTTVDRLYYLGGTGTLKNGANLTVITKARFTHVQDSQWYIYDGSFSSDELAVSDGPATGSLSMLHPNALITLIGLNNDEGLWVADDGDSIGHVQLDAGMIRTTQVGSRGTATMEINGGTLVLPGNVTDVQSWIVAGSGSLVFNYHSGADETYITPEPATVALLGLGGLALLRKRR